MVYCCAVGCSNDSRSVSKEHGISFHRLPTEGSLLQEWLAKISRVDFVVTKDTRLCSDHFEPDCFERDLKAELLGLKAKRTLKPDAVPTIFVHRPRKKPRLSSENRLHDRAKKELFARAVRVVTGLPCLVVCGLKIYATKSSMPGSAEKPVENADDSEDDDDDDDDDVLT